MKFLPTTSICLFRIILTWNDRSTELLPDARFGTLADARAFLATYTVPKGCFRADTLYVGPRKGRYTVN